MTNPIAVRAMRHAVSLCVGVLLLSFTGLSYAEIINVRYRGTIDTTKTPLKTVTKPAAAFVTALWYDKATGYLVAGIGKGYYHYCEVSEADLLGWPAHDRPGLYFQYIIRPNDCREGGVPAYP